MPSKRKALIGSLLILVVAVGALQYDRRHVVRPKNFGASTARLESNPVQVTLHKYFTTEGTSAWYQIPQHWRWETTGESTAFEFTGSYLNSTHNLSGGAQYSIYISFDSETLEPRKSVAAAQQKAVAKEKMANRNIGAELYFMDPKVQSQTFQTYWRSCFGGSRTCKGSLGNADNSLKGLRVFTESGSPQYAMTRYWSEVFSGSNGSEPVLISCMGGDNAKRCRATTSFENWHLEVVIPRQRLSDWSKLIADARTLFDRNLIQRTAPRE